MDNELQKQILESINKSGKSETPELKINTNIDHVLSFSSGSARLQTTLLRKVVLILSKPLGLRELSSQQIRCCLCHRVISYPAWYYEVKYAVNNFHYFVCFDFDSPTKPNTKCYKKE